MATKEVKYLIKKESRRPHNMELSSEGTHHGVFASIMTDFARHRQGACLGWQEPSIYQESRV